MSSTNTTVSLVGLCSHECGTQRADAEAAGSPTAPSTVPKPVTVARDGFLLNAAVADPRAVCGTPAGRARTTRAGARTTRHESARQVIDPLKTPYRARREGRHTLRVRAAGFSRSTCSAGVTSTRRPGPRPRDRQDCAVRTNGMRLVRPRRCDGNVTATLRAT